MVCILMYLYYLQGTHTSVFTVKFAYLEHLFAFGRKAQGIHSVYSNWENTNIPYNLSALYCFCVATTAGDVPRRDRVEFHQARSCGPVTQGRISVRTQTRFDGPAGSPTVMRITDDTTCCTRCFKLGMMISK